MARVWGAAAAVWLGLASGVTAQVTMAPWNEGVELLGWSEVGAGDNALLLMRSAPPAGKHRRAWSRYELRPGYGAHRSSVTLYEYDCTERRQRQLQYATYQEPNMSGHTRSFPPHQEWEYVMPGTLSERGLDVTCRATPLT